MYLNILKFPNDFTGKRKFLIHIADPIAVLVKHRKVPGDWPGWFGQETEFMWRELDS